MRSASIGLACVAAFLAAGVGGVMLAGWRIAGNESAWFPSLLVVAMAVVSVAVIGQVSGTMRVLFVVASTVVAIAFAHGIIWARGDDAFAGSHFDSLAAYVLALLFGGLHDRILTRLHSFVHVDVPKTHGTFVSIASSTWRFNWLAVVLLVWIALVAVSYQHAVVVNRTGFRIITVPFDQPSAAMPLAGFSVWRGDRPVMMETIPAIEQVQWFSGQVRSDNNFRFLRSGYAFAATIFLGVMHPETALRCVNGLAWLGTLAVIGGLCLAWPCQNTEKDESVNRYAALSAVSLAAVGVGFGILINDTTPHVMAFCLYAIGIAMIFGLGFAESPQVWSRHLGFALAVGFFSWTYNVAQMLLFVYVLVSLRHQRWLSTCVTVLIVLLHRPIWRWYLPALGINVREVEGEYLVRTIAHWRVSLDDGLTKFFSDVLYYGWESVTAMETPWLMAMAAVGAWGVVPRTQCRLWLSAWIAPVLSSVVFAPTSFSRGYIVFGGSLVVYLIVGRWLGWWMAQRGVRRFLAIIGLVLLAMANFVWTTAHHHGWYGPAKVFLMGWPNASAVVASPPSVVLDAAASHPVPRSLGGDGHESMMTSHPRGTSDLRYVSDAPIVVKSFVIAVLSRLPYILSIILLVSLVSRSVAWRLGSVISLLLFFLVTTLVGFASVTRQNQYFDPGRAIVMQPGETLTYQIQLDATSRARFAKVADQVNAADLHLWIGTGDAVQVTWSADGRVVPTEPVDGQRLRTSSTVDLDRVITASVWQFKFTNEADDVAYLHGWQPATSFGRRLSRDSQVLPAVEIRLREPTSQALSAVMY